MDKLKEVYSIVGTYRDPSCQNRGQSEHMAFLTQREAIDYCNFHSSDHMQFTWRKLTIGKFKVRITKSTGAKKKVKRG